MTYKYNSQKVGGSHRIFSLLLFISFLPSDSNTQLSSFYSLVSSLANNKTNKPLTVSQSQSHVSTPKAKRSSISGDLSPISSSQLELPLSLPPSSSSPDAKVEQLNFFQTLLRNIVVTQVREELADVSSHWANKAHSVVSSKYEEVIRLTRETHEAQILNLERASVALLLNNAVAKAHQVYHSALRRYKILEATAQTSKVILVLVSEALSLLLQIFARREESARAERGRAFRLSTEYLRKVLEDLKAATEFAQSAHSIVLEMR